MVFKFFKGLLFAYFLLIFSLPITQQKPLSGKFDLKNYFRKPPWSRKLFQKAAYDKKIEADVSSIQGGVQLDTIKEHRPRDSLLLYFQLFKLCVWADFKTNRLPVRAEISTSNENTDKLWQKQFFPQSERTALPATREIVNTNTQYCASLLLLRTPYPTPVLLYRGHDQRD